MTPLKMGRNKVLIYVGLILIVVSILVIVASWISILHTPTNQPGSGVSLAVRYGIVPFAFVLLIGVMLLLSGLYPNRFYWRR